RRADRANQGLDGIGRRESGYTRKIGRQTELIESLGPRKVAPDGKDHHDEQDESDSHSAGRGRHRLTRRKLQPYITDKRRHQGADDKNDARDSGHPETRNDENLREKKQDADTEEDEFPTLHKPHHIMRSKKEGRANGGDRSREAHPRRLELEVQPSHHHEHEQRLQDRRAEKAKQPFRAGRAMLNDLR